MAAPATEARTKITIEAVVDAPVDVVWKLFADPEHIVQWNAASDDWHTTAATNDLVVGGRFSSTMAAKDGSSSFDFGGTYTDVKTHESIAYALEDDRMVRVAFTALDAKRTRVVETFDAEGTHSVEQQKSGWQAILNNFKKHVEAHVRESP